MSAKLIDFPGRKHRSMDGVTPDSVLSDLIGTGLMEVVVLARRQGGGVIVAASSDDVESALALLDEAREELGGLRATV